MSRQSHPYNQSYSPAFPALSIVLHNSDEGENTETVEALLDTGADGTLVPLSYLQEIYAPPIQETRIRSHWGEWRPVTLFVVDLSIGHLRLPGIFVVGDEDGDEIILGRNVLNKLRLNLNGLDNLTTLPPQ